MKVTKKMRKCIVEVDERLDVVLDELRKQNMEYTLIYHSIERFINLARGEFLRNEDEA